MSQYTQFFLRSKTNEFMPIGIFGRSNAISRAFNDYAPYESIRAFSLDDLKRILDEVKEDVSYYNRTIAEQQEKLRMIATFNNSVEDKMEALESINNIITDYKDSLEEATYAENFVSFLITIVDDAKYNDEGYNSDELLYVGIEVGSPTVDDIK